MDVSMIDTTAPKMRYLKDYQPADFSIATVFLYIDLGEEITTVKTVLNMSRNTAAHNPKAPLVLEGEALKLISVSLNGEKLKSSQYKVDDEHLTIFDVPDQFDLETVVEIEPQKNTKLMGLFKSRGNYCTQCESQGFRRITYYLDRPDVLARFTTTISADKTRYPMLLSNGNLISTKTLEHNRHWVHWEDPTLKPCYLFALVAGDFDLLQDHFVTQSGRKVLLELYVEKGFKDQADFALGALKRAMKWDEKTFGREYDLDRYMIVAVSDFTMGAMENKGLNIFNTKYILAKPETATDMDFVAIESVIGHEYFHNWSGNRVTCRDWFQITLKEGLTVFRDQLFTEDMFSQGVARLDEVSVVRNRQFVEDAGPMAHPIRPNAYVEVNNFYTATVYRKGAEVIRMIRTLLTPPVFRKGMDLYFNRHDGQAVTSEDFVKAMADASGKDLTQFWRWYEQAGTPELTIDGQYDEKAKTFTLNIKQSCPPTPGQPHKEPFDLPLAVGLVGPHCADYPLQLEHEQQATPGTKILEIKKSEQRFVFVKVPEKPVPSLLRGFSAPVKIRYSYTNKDLAWLLRCDSDPFVKWDAGQQLVVNLVNELITQHQQHKSFAMNSVLLEAIGYLLTTPISDLSLLSRLLVFPSHQYLLMNNPGTDMELIHQARQFIQNRVAVGLENHFLVLYNHHQAKKYIFNAEEVGKRSIKNIALFYLLETGKAEYRELAYRQFKASNNMTDTVGALRALNNQDCKEREQALAEFYQRWQKDPLVINKWFLMQATSTLPNTLDKVKELLAHPAFDLCNPNNVYSLVCGFGENAYRLHDSEGKGYEFLSDQVLAIDEKNPIVAGRVIQPLLQWRVMDKERAKLMQNELQRIAKKPNLSKDIYEIVSKSIV